jgi:hypothetical protein
MLLANLVGTLDWYPHVSFKYYTGFKPWSGRLHSRLRRSDSNRKKNNAKSFRSCKNLELQTGRRERNSLDPQISWR